MEGGDMTSIKLIGILISCSFITIITGKYNAKNYFRLKKRKKRSEDYLQLYLYLRFIVVFPKQKCVPNDNNYSEYRSHLVNL
jgi:ABC-type antimicrobial peptide transport system permease subunit